MKKFTKRENFIVRFIAGMIAAVLLFADITIAARAEDLPYDTYTYDYWEDVVYTPSAYVPGNIIYGQQLVYQGECIGAFVSPQDMCKSEDGLVYVADTGNNRIVVLDQTMTEVTEIIDGFVNEDAQDGFQSPTGVCVNADNHLYVADSINRRIVILDLDNNCELIKIVDNPTSEILDPGFVFTPLKVSVDYAGRIYCIAQNMFEGIMVFEENGEFTGFFGTIEVKISLWEKFWKKLATKEERAKSQLFIPTEFTGIDIDESGFVYATNIDSEGMQAVRRLNPKGEDVIRKGQNNNVGGDLWIDGSTSYAGPSQITDVVYRQKGIYSLLDRRRGRIFTYDHEGNLLYIFGGMGSQAGTFSAPVAIEYIGDKLVVLDSNRASITCFDPTQYGTLINEAVALRYDGDETLAVEKWQEVLKLNENLELANSGIGKAYLTAGDNLMAMHYLQLAMNREYYSIAYKRYRNEILGKNLKYVLSGILVFVIGFEVISKVVEVKEKRKKKDKSSKGGSAVE